MNANPGRGQQQCGTGGAPGTRGKQQQSGTGKGQEKTAACGDETGDIQTDLILDQTIEKVSFCAPDRNYDKAFSYICRDGTPRRWICHCFMALKDSVSLK
ncbi:UNVERIFIED_CONTAM: hypothetical protein FKN15_013305 [Acipenser sinensis]